MKTYAEKLKDPRWQKKRLEIMQRDDFTCQICESKTKTLHIHHKKYSGDPWQVESDMLKTLCEDCHEMIENFKSVDILRTMIHPVWPTIIILYGINENGSKIIIFWSIDRRELITGISEKSILMLING